MAAHQEAELAKEEAAQPVRDALLVLADAAVVVEVAAPQAVPAPVAAPAPQGSKRKRGGAHRAPPAKKQPGCMRQEATQDENGVSVMSGPVILPHHVHHLMGNLKNCDMLCVLGLCRVTC